MSTQVNTENPIFHRPATDTIPADVSLTQERINNGELLEEKKAAPTPEPVAEPTPEPVVESVPIDPEPEPPVAVLAPEPVAEEAAVEPETPQDTPETPAEG